jgi:maltose alpha-D-glucosyltransferase / alpha-amylase
MGENLTLPGRLAVRGPMQWSPGPAGGFSPAAELYRPACADGPYGYRTVNVAGQRHQPGSLYSWVAHASRILRECPELGWGDWQTLDAGDPRVLAIDYRWRDGHLVTLHNLSAGPVKIRLPAGLGDEESPSEVHQVLGDGPAPDITQEIPLDGYGFRWLRLPG